MEKRRRRYCFLRQSYGANNYVVCSKTNVKPLWASMSSYVKGTWTRDYRRIFFLPILYTVWGATLCTSFMDARVKIVIAPGK